MQSVTRLGVQLDDVANLGAVALAVERPHLHVVGAEREGVERVVLVVEGSDLATVEPLRQETEDAHHADAIERVDVTGPAVGFEEAVEGVVVRACQRRVAACPFDFVPVVVHVTQEALLVRIGRAVGEALRAAERHAVELQLEERPCESHAVEQHAVRERARGVGAGGDERAEVSHGRLGGELPQQVAEAVGVSEVRH
jgi:hypothetical protein